MNARRAKKKKKDDRPPIPYRVAAMIYFLTGFVLIAGSAAVGHVNDNFGIAVLAGIILFAGMAASMGYAMSRWKLHDVLVGPGSYVAGLCLLAGALCGKLVAKLYAPRLVADLLTGFF